MTGDGASPSENVAVRPGPRETEFFQALENITVAPEPLEEFKSTDCSSTTFAVFALNSQLTEAALQGAANAFNEQAKAELGFTEAEFAEMGVVATVPASWQVQDESAMGATQWFLDDFNKRGDGTARDPQWFPYAFIGIASRDWRDNGVVVVYIKDHGELMEGEALPIVAFVASPEKIGSMLNTLRQHQDHIDNVREDDEMV